MLQAEKATEKSKRGSRSDIHKIPEIWKKPPFLRTDFTEAKILNYLGDEKNHGVREIQKATRVSFATLSSYLGPKKWESKGIIVRVGKQRKVQITKLGLEELEVLNRRIKRYPSDRLISRTINIPLPSISAEDAAKRVFVTVGVNAGTPNPLSLETQATIEAIVRGEGTCDQKARKIRNRFGFDWVKYSEEYFVGTPTL